MLLSSILYPLCNRLDVYKICFLLTIAVGYTIPWDSYLIRTGIWSKCLGERHYHLLTLIAYPPGSILGPKLFDIPAEELFFFVVQTYIV